MNYGPFYKYIPEPYIRHIQFYKYIYIYIYINIITIRVLEILYTVK